MTSPYREMETAGDLPQIAPTILASLSNNKWLSRSGVVLSGLNGYGSQLPPNELGNSQGAYNKVPLPDTLLSPQHFVETCSTIEGSINSTPEPVKKSAVLQNGQDVVDFSRVVNFEQLNGKILPQQDLQTYHQVSREMPEYLEMGQGDGQLITQNRHALQKHQSEAIVSSKPPLGQIPPPPSSNDVSRKERPERTQSSEVHSDLQIEQQKTPEKKLSNRPVPMLPSLPSTPTEYRINGNPDLDSDTASIQTREPEEDFADFIRPLDEGASQISDFPLFGKEKVNPAVPGGPKKNNKDRKKLFGAAETDSQPDLESFTNLNAHHRNGEVHSSQEDISGDMDMLGDPLLAAQGYVNLLDVPEVLSGIPDAMLEKLFALHQEGHYILVAPDGQLVIQNISQSEGGTIQSINQSEGGTSLWGTSASELENNSVHALNNNSLKTKNASNGIQAYSEHLHNFPPVPHYSDSNQLLHSQNEVRLPETVNPPTSQAALSQHSQPTNKLSQHSQPTNKLSQHSQPMDKMSQLSQPTDQLSQHAIKNPSELSTLSAASAKPNQFYAQHELQLNLLEFGEMHAGEQSHEGLADVSDEEDPSDSEYNNGPDDEVSSGEEEEEHEAMASPEVSLEDIESKPINRPHKTFEELLEEELRKEEERLRRHLEGSPEPEQSANNSGKKKFLRKGEGVAARFGVNGKPPAPKVKQKPTRKSAGAGWRSGMETRKVQPSSQPAATKTQPRPQKREMEQAKKATRQLKETLKQKQVRSKDSTAAEQISSHASNNHVPNELTKSTKSKSQGKKLSKKEQLKAFLKQSPRDTENKNEPSLASTMQPPDSDTRPEVKTQGPTPSSSQSQFKSPKKSVKPAASAADKSLSVSKIKDESEHDELEEFEILEEFAEDNVSFVSTVSAIKRAMNEQQGNSNVSSRGLSSRNFDGGRPQPLIEQDENDETLADDMSDEGNSTLIEVKTPATAKTSRTDPHQQGENRSIQPANSSPVIGQQQGASKQVQTIQAKALSADCVHLNSNPAGAQLATAKEERTDFSVPSYGNNLRDKFSLSPAHPGQTSALPLKPGTNLESLLAQNQGQVEKSYISPRSGPVGTNLHNGHLSSGSGEDVVSPRSGQGSGHGVRTVQRKIASHGHGVRALMIEQCDMDEEEEEEEGEDMQEPAANGFNFDDGEAWDDNMDDDDWEAEFQKRAFPRHEPAQQAALTNSGAGAAVESPPPTSKLVTKIFPSLKPEKKKNISPQQEEQLEQARQAVPDVDSQQARLIRDKLAELEKEIERFRAENAKLERVGKEREESLALLKTNMADFEREKDAELRRIQEIKNDEMKKLKREKKQFEERQKVLKEQPNKKEREEIDSLKTQLSELQDELRRRESRWSSSAARLRDRVEALETENAELKEEVRLLEKLRIEAWHQKEAAKESKQPPLLERYTPASQPVTNSAGLRNGPTAVSALSSTKSSVPAHLPAEVKSSQEKSSSKNHVKTRNSSKDGGDASSVKSQPQMHRSVAPLTQPLHPGVDRDVRLSASADSGTLGLPVDGLSQTVLSPEQDMILPEDSASNVAGLDSTSRPRTALKLRSSDYPSANPPKVPSISIASVIDKGDGKFEEVCHPDGKVEYVYSNGAREILFPNGTRKLISADSQTITVAFFNGDIKQVLPDQRIVYYYTEAQTTQTSYPDGLEILQFPNNQTEKNYPDGTKEITFPDQTVKYLFTNGAEESLFLDGTVVRVENGQKTMEFPNGQKEIHTPQFKKREYPDGTVKTVYPDGRQETKYSSGRIRVKDKDGNLIVDQRM